MSTNSARAASVVFAVLLHLVSIRQTRPISRDKDLNRLLMRVFIGVGSGTLQFSPRNVEQNADDHCGEMLCYQVAADLRDVLGGLVESLDWWVFWPFDSACIPQEHIVVNWEAYISQQ